MFSAAAARRLVATSVKNRPFMVSLKSGGCAGFEYDIRPMEDGEDSGDPGDEVMRVGKVQVRVDKTSLMWLIGTEVDWVEDRMGSRFVFNNPNASSQCGCGISFSPNVCKQRFES